MPPSAWLPLAVLLPTLAAAASKESVHIVFSSGCNAYQSWQAELLAWSALRVGHKGPLTRIASGCDEKTDYAALRRSTNPNLRVHVTPKFDLGEGRMYFPFYNKPFGMQHWLKNTKIKEDYVVVIDPDFIFLEPFDPFRLTEANSITSLTGADYQYVLQHLKPAKGFPMAQFYGIGAKWTTWDVKKIAGADSPAAKITDSQAWAHFSVGPPYIWQIDDARMVVDSWVKFMVSIRENFPELVAEDVLAEMYAYCLAAAHHNLKHTRMDNFMVSAIDAYGEAWEWVDKLVACTLVKGPSSLGAQISSVRVGNRGQAGQAGHGECPGAHKPSFIHMASAFVVGDFKFHKKHVPLNVLDCTAPKVAYTDCSFHELRSFHTPKCFKTNAQSLWEKALQEGTKCYRATKKGDCVREAWTITTLMEHIDGMASDYKEKFCEPGYNSAVLGTLGAPEDQGVQMDPQGAPISNGPSTKGLKPEYLAEDTSLAALAAANAQADRESEEETTAGSKQEKGAFKGWSKHVQSQASAMHEHVKEGRKAHVEREQDYQQWKERMYNLKKGDSRVDAAEMEGGEAMQAITLAVIVLVVVLFMKSQEQKPSRSFKKSSV